MTAMHLWVIGGLAKSVKKNSGLTGVTYSWGGGGYASGGGGVKWSYITGSIVVK